MERDNLRFKQRQVKYLINLDMERPMSKSPQEWLKQADYDMETAEIMFDNKRHIYAVFMCHLAIEKILKE